MAKKTLETFDYERAARVVDDATVSAAAVLDALKGRPGVEHVEAQAARFFEKVDEVQSVLESIPLRDGIPTRALGDEERAELMSQLTDLVPKMQRFLERHVEIAGALRNLQKADQARLDLLRHAREIFERFVRKGGKEQEAPKFFDRKG